jgi:hypothetical protein
VEVLVLDGEVVDGGAVVGHRQLTEPCRCASGGRSEILGFRRSAQNPRSVK